MFPRIEYQLAFAFTRLWSKAPLRKTINSFADNDLKELCSLRFLLPDLTISPETAVIVQAPRFNHSNTTRFPPRSSKNRALSCKTLNTTNFKMVQLQPLTGTDYYLWKYVPSLAASAIFVTLFTGVTAALCWRMFRTRSWFCIPFVVGGICTLHIPIPEETKRIRS